MNTSEILEALEAEIAKLLHVKGLLTGDGKTAKKRGRPAKTTSIAVGDSKPKKRWTMSAAARSRIGAAQKARWAKLRKTQKVA